MLIFYRITPLLIIGLLFFLLFLVVLFLLSLEEVRQIKIKRYNIDEENNVQKADFTDEIKGISIVFFSDLHVGKLLQKEELKKKVQFLADLDADLYIFGGDFIGSQIKKYYTIEDIETCFEPLKKKTKIAVFGNHEFKKEKKITLEEKEKFFQAMGFHLLNNERFLYQKEGQEILFFGMQETIYHECLQDILPCDIVISHEADCLLNFPSSFIALSGHTHGGQIRLPLIPIYYRPKHGRKMTSGLYKRNKKQILISNGLGCNGIKMRFFAPSDIIMIDYRRKEKKANVY